MIENIDHVAIAVKSLEEAQTVYEPFLETSPHVVTQSDQGARIGIYQLNHSRIELLEPLTEDSPIARFLDRQGEGIHHVALRTDDVDSELNRASTLENVTCIDDNPREGAENYSIAFLHPNSFHGALVELAQPPND